MLFLWFSAASLQRKSSWVLAVTITHLHHSCAKLYLCQTLPVPLLRHRWARVRLQGKLSRKETHLGPEKPAFFLVSFLNFSWAFFWVLTAPPFPGRGHDRDVDTQMTPKILYFGSSWSLLHPDTANYTFYLMCTLKMQRSWVCSPMSLCTMPRLSTCPAKPGESSGAVWALTSSQVISLLIQKMQLRVTHKNPD